MAETDNSGCRKGCLFAIVGFVIVAVIGNLASNRSTTTTVPTTSTLSAPPDTMGQHRARIEAESILQATPNVAKLSDSQINSVTNVIPHSMTSIKAQQLWKEYFRRNESRQAAQAKRDAAERVSQILGLASCKPSRARVTSLIANHGEWDNDDLATVACRNIRIGMSADQVVAAWGRPQDINTTTTAHGTHEQWVWEDSDGLPYQYAYIEGGVLTAIQN